MRSRWHQLMGIIVNCRRLTNDDADDLPAPTTNIASRMHLTKPSRFEKNAPTWCSLSEKFTEITKFVKNRPPHPAIQNLVSMPTQMCRVA
jgi:hypothetical protein